MLTAETVDSASKNKTNTCTGRKAVVRFMRTRQSLDPCKNLRGEGGVTLPTFSSSQYGGRLVIGGVPEELVVLHPLPEDWLYRSTQPVAGSTLPRQRCSQAGLRAESLLPPPPLLEVWPEGLLDLGRGQQRTS